MDKQFEESITSEIIMRVHKFKHRKIAIAKAINITIHKVQSLFLEEDKWLIFREEKPNKKTKIISVLSRCDGCLLGIIKWHPSWRHYCFFPTIEIETVHSDRCLLNIGFFVLKLNQEHDDARRKNKNP